MPKGPSVEKASPYDPRHITPVCRFHRTRSGIVLDIFDPDAQITLPTKHRHEAPAPDADAKKLRFPDDGKKNRCLLQKVRDCAASIPHGFQEKLRRSTGMGCGRPDASSGQLHPSSSSCRREHRNDEDDDGEGDGATTKRIHDFRTPKHTLLASIVALLQCAIRQEQFEELYDRTVSGWNVRKNTDSCRSVRRAHGRDLRQF